MEHFERVCLAHGLARTHQRQISYRTLAQSDAHPSPEAIYDKVRREIPSISLGTVYKNITTFLRVGLLRELNLSHEPLRLDPNLTNHHHVICTRCRTVADLAEDEVEPVRIKRKLPAGFRMERYEVDVIGICAQCAERTGNEHL
jgi:Fur family peroxide stress response transcriptional regulator